MRSTLSPAPCLTDGLPGDSARAAAASLATPGPGNAQDASCNPPPGPAGDRATAATHPPGPGPVVPRQGFAETPTPAPRAAAASPQPRAADPTSPNGASQANTADTVE